MHLSLIIPLYNEGETLEKNISQVLLYLKKQSYLFEIILVNDGSTDNTIDLSKKLSKKHKSINVIDLKKNYGKGYALRTGLMAGRGKYLGFSDADNASPIKNLEVALKSLEHNDIVIGSRNKHDSSGAKQIVSQNIFKRILGISGNKLIKLIIKQNIHDTQCGFKVFRRKSIDAIIPKTKINRWAIDVEILLLAFKNNLSVGIIPINWTCGPISRVGLKGYFITLVELGKIKWNDLRGDYE